MTVRVLLVFSVTSLAGCAGHVDYVGPVAASQGLNTITIAKPRDAVWKTAVPELGKRFFVINNLDKDSGLINVSYTGDPEAYVDCGRITSEVQNAAGKRNYEFAGSKADQFYETLAPGKPLVHIRRRMKLEGRVNLIFQASSDSETTVTANTKYVLTREQIAQVQPNGFPQSASDTISFNTGSGGTFTPNSQGSSLLCVSTGKLEAELLSAIQ